MEITCSVNITTTLKVCTGCIPRYSLCLKVVFVWASGLKSVSDFLEMLLFWKCFWYILLSKILNTLPGLMPRLHS